MARSFDDAQSEYLKRDGVPPVTAYPFVMACKFRIQTGHTTSTSGLMWLGDKDAVKHEHILFYTTGTGKCWIESRVDANRQNVTCDQVIANNTWYHICGLFVSATDRRILINNANKATNSGNVTPVNLDRIVLGAFGRSVLEAFLHGEIAEAAIYDLSALPGETDSDKADYFEANVLPGLAASKRPSVYPTGLEAYWDLVSDDDDKAGSYDLTPFNAPSWATHPDILCLETEDATATDAQDRLRILTAEITESATAEDEQNAIGNIFNVTVTETATAEDTENGARLYTAEITETTEATDTQDGIVPTIHESAIVEVAVATDVQDCYLFYIEIPPFMEKDLIDPYASGAWLWLAEIAVPTKDTVRIARNTEDVKYAGQDFDKFNLEVGAQTFSGDGSIPRITLRTFQDSTRQIENIINETEGALGGAVKLIRVNEKWLTSVVSALEADYDLLASQSDSEWCTFTLGIPNPLTQRYPLVDFCSSVCPWTSPELYKGPECQCVHEDAACTGTYADCLSKDNETRWGGELGLSPSVVKERRQ